MRLHRLFFTLEYSHYSINRKATSLTKDVNALLAITKKKQAPVVRRSDNAIQWIDLYPVDNAIRFVITYPLDSDLSVG